MPICDGQCVRHRGLSDTESGRIIESFIHAAIITVTVTVTLANSYAGSLPGLQIFQRRYRGRAQGIFEGG